MPKRLIIDSRKPKGSVVRNASGPVTISLVRHDPKHLDTIITPRVMSDSRAALRRMRTKQAGIEAIRPRPGAGA
jgi:hypothetical protein